MESSVGESVSVGVGSTPEQMAMQGQKMQRNFSQKSSQKQQQQQQQQQQQGKIQSGIAVLLRRWKSDLEIDCEEYGDRCQLSPDRSFISFLSTTQKLSLYATVNEEFCFSLTEVVNYCWLEGEKVTLLVVSRVDALEFYKIPRDSLNFGQPLEGSLDPLEGHGYGFSGEEDTARKFVLPFARLLEMTKSAGVGDFGRVAYLGCDGFNLMVCLDSCVVLVFQIDALMMKLIRGFKIPPQSTHLCLKQSWICFLVNSFLHLWNINGKKQVRILIPQKSKQDEENNSEFMFDLSSDLKTLSYVYEPQKVCIINLDTFFQAYPSYATPIDFDSLIDIGETTNQESGEEETEENSKTWRHYFGDHLMKEKKRSQFLRWFECNNDLSVEDLTPNWFPKEPSPFTITPKKDLFMTSEDDEESNYALNGFKITQNNITPIPAKQVQQKSTEKLVSSSFSKSISSSYSKSLFNERYPSPTESTPQQTNPSPTHINYTGPGVTELSLANYLLPSNYIKNIYATPVSLFLTISSPTTNSAQSLLFIDRVSYNCAVHSLTEDGSKKGLNFGKDGVVFIINPNLSGVYYVTKIGFGVVVVGTDRDRITNALIIFHGPSLTETLYSVNQWERRSLRIHALSMGLRYRQLDVVKEALESLDQDQEVYGARKLLDFMQNTKLLVQDQSFIIDLSHISMEFVASAIQKRVNTIISNIDSAMSLHDEITLFSSIITNLQVCSTSVRNLKSIITPAAISSSPISPLVSPKNSVGSGSFIKFRLPFSSGSSLNFSDGSKSDGVESLAATSFVGTEDLELRENERELMEVAEPPHKWAETEISYLEEMNLVYQEAKETDWDKMSDIQVAADALRKGKVSLALSYLRWRGAKNRDSSESVFGEGKTKKIDLVTLTKWSFLLIYQAVLNGKVEDARSIANNIGADVEELFKEISWRTSRRDVRNALISYLKDTNKISTEDSEIIRWATLLEQFYPNSDFSQEFKTDSIREVKKRRDETVYTDQLINNEDFPSSPFEESKDLDDISPSNLMRLGFRYDSENSLSSELSIPFKSTTTGESGKGYIHFKLEWLYNWDTETIYRVLLESSLSMGEPIDKHFKSNQIITQLQYYISHNDITRLIEWTKQIDTNGYTVGEMGDIILLTDSKKSEISLPELFVQVEKEIEYCPIFLAEILRSKLARRGIFVMRKEYNSLRSVMIDLSSNGLLMGTSKTEQNSLSLSNLLPERSFSKFHKYFIKYCIQNGLMAILQHYLNTFNLSKTEKEIHELNLVGIGTAASSLLCNVEGKEPSPPQEANPFSESEQLRTSLFLLFRSHSNTFSTSLLNAQLCLALPPQTAININTILKNTMDGPNRNHPFIALSTLVYSPLGIKGSLLSQPNSVFYVAENLLKQSTRNYPLLYDAIFPSPLRALTALPSTPNISLSNIQSSLADVDLLTLLQEHKGISIDGLFPPLPEENNSELLSNHLNTPTFNSEQFSSDRFKAQIDAKHYLGSAQPFHAFEVLLRSEKGEVSWREESPEKGSETVKFIVESGFKLQLLWEVRSACLRKLDDIAILSSGVCFLEQCGIETETLLVDIKCAKFLVEWKKSRNDSSALDDVTELFLQISSTKTNRPRSGSLTLNKQKKKNNYDSDGSLFQVLSLLREAVSSKIEKDYIEALSLLALFTRVHSLPLDTTILEHHASSNDWVSFLYAGQMLDYPIDTLITIASNHFKKESLREHIIVCLKQITTNDTMKVAEIDPTEHDLFRLITQSRNTTNPVATLLSLSLSKRRPLLSIIAATYPDCNPAIAMLVWIYTSLDDSFWGKGKFTISLRKGMVANTEALEDLKKIFMVLSDAGYYTYILKAFELFAPRHVLFHWFKFAVTFKYLKFEKAKAYLKKFVKKNVSENFVKLNGIGNSSWVKAVSSALVDNLIENCPTDYEKGHLLELLYAAEYSDRHVQLHLVFSLLQQAGLGTALPFDTVLPPPKDIIELLLKKEKFTEAHKYVSIAGLDRTYNDKITESEVRVELAKRKEAMKWTSNTIAPAQRKKPRRGSGTNEFIVGSLVGAQAVIDVLASEVGQDQYISRSNSWNKNIDAKQPANRMWETINDLFIKNKCSPLVVSDFYLNEVDEPNITVIEKITLLTLTLDWVKGVYNQKIHAYPTGDNSFKYLGEKYSSYWKSPTFTEELESRILQITVQAEINTLSNSKKKVVEEVIIPKVHEEEDYRNKDAGIPKTQNPPKTKNEAETKQEESSMIDIVVGRLINEGNLEEAFKVCQQFKHSSTDLEIVKVMTDMARGLSTKFLDQRWKKLANITTESLENSSILEVLENLSKLCVNAKLYADRIVVFHKISALLCITFTEVSEYEPYALLLKLLDEGPSNYPLVKDYIRTKNLDKYRVAMELSDYCLKSILQKSNHTMSMNSSQLPKIKSPPVSQTLPSAYMFNSPDSPGPGELSGWTSPRAALQNSPGNPEKYTWSSHEFVLFISLADNPSDVGNAFLEFLGNNQVSPDHEVEILIHAHFCFLISANMAGVDKVLELAKRCIHTCVQKNEYKILVRLLTGTKQYVHLQNILDHLVKSNQFEMLLGKTVVADEESKTELKMALYLFLKNFYPNEEEKLKWVFLKFGMFREHAEMLHDKANNKLSEIVVKPGAMQVPLLLDIMDKYINAAEYYQKASSFSLSQECYQQAELIGLQIEYQDTVYINLDKAAVRQLMKNCSVFERALIVAQAYELDELSEWSSPVFYQVIENGNFDFLSDLSGHVLLTNQFFKEIVKKFKQLTNPKKQLLINMKNFLKFLDDHFLRYEFAVELNFLDVISSLQHLPGLTEEGSKIFYSN